MDFIKIRFGNSLNHEDSMFMNNIDAGMVSNIHSVFTVSERTWKPYMDMYETRQDVIICAEIAGVTKEDLDIEIDDNAVRIAGKRFEGSRDDMSAYKLAEIQYGRFERVLFLPAPIDSKKVTASFKDGFLKIRLEKLSENKTHKIPISDG